jgi:hypothetical protein
MMKSTISVPRRWPASPRSRIVRRLRSRSTSSSSASRCTPDLRSTDRRLSCRLLPSCTSRARTTPVFQALLEALGQALLEDWHHDHGHHGDWATRYRRAARSVAAGARGRTTVIAGSRRLAEPAHAVLHHLPLEWIDARQAAAPAGSQRWAVSPGPIGPGARTRMIPQRSVLRGASEPRRNFSLRFHTTSPTFRSATCAA